MAIDGEPPPQSNVPSDSSIGETYTVTRKESFDLYQCSKCQEKLGRHRFPKKIFRKLIIEGNKIKDRSGHNSTEGSNGYRQQNQKQERLVCHQCKRLETAKRCKQTPPRPIQHDNTRAESGVKRRPNNFGYCDYVDKLFGMDCFSSDIAPLKVFTSAKDISESMAAIQAVLKHGRIESASASASASEDGIEDIVNGGRDSGILCLCIGDGCTPRTALLMAFLAKERDRWECVSIDPALSEEWTPSSVSSTIDDSSNDVSGAHSVTKTNAKGVRGLYGYKGTLKEFLGDPNRPPWNRPQGTNATKVNYRRRWRHLVLVCVHSHARFVDEASIENIRLLYASPKSNSEDSDAAAVTDPDRDDISDSDSESRRQMKTTFILPPTTIVSLPCCPTFRHVRDIGTPPDLKYDDDCVFSACRSVEVWNMEEEEEEKVLNEEDPRRDKELFYCSENPTNFFFDETRKQ